MTEKALERRLEEAARELGTPVLTIVERSLLREAAAALRSSAGAEPVARALGPITTAPAPASVREEIALKLMEFDGLRRWELTDREWSEYLRRADVVLAIKAKPEMTFERMHECYEIADGAFGDNPSTRGAAIKALRDAGHDYPAASSPTVEGVQPHGRGATKRRGSAHDHPGE